MYVVFATPSLDHKVSLDFLNSVLDVRLLLAQRSIPHAFLQIGGDCFVAKARNKLATWFLRNHPEATDLFFLDDDIGFPAQKVIDFLERDVDFLAGIYPKKTDRLDFPVTLASNGIGELIERNGLIQAHAVSAGFLRMRRDVVERLAQSSTIFKDSIGGSAEEFYNIFETGRGADGFFWGEDYTLCQKWASMGGEIWVDPDVAFKHRGQKSWTASLTDSLAGYREQAIASVKEAA